MPTDFSTGKAPNVSRTGVFVSVPMAAPIREGHIVEINFPRTTALAKEKGQYARIKTGKVVRVDRSDLLKDGWIGIGVAFD